MKRQTLSVELRERIRAARDEHVRARIGSISAAEKVERQIERELSAYVADDTAEWLAGRCLFPAVPGFDVEAHLAGVAQSVALALTTR